MWRRAALVKDDAGRAVSRFRMVKLVQRRPRRKPGEPVNVRQTPSLLMAELCPSQVS